MSPPDMVNAPGTVRENGITKTWSAAFMVSLVGPLITGNSFAVIVQPFGASYVRGVLLLLCRMVKFVVIGAAAGIETLSPLPGCMIKFDVSVPEPVRLIRFAFVMR